MPQLATDMTGEEQAKSEHNPVDERRVWSCAGAELLGWVKTFGSAAIYATLIVTLVAAR